jgi:hypothetical protein
MAESLERARERGPEQETLYDRSVRARMEDVERKRRGMVVLRDRDVPWDDNRQGKLKFYTNPLSFGETEDPTELPALTDFKVFVHDIHTNSGSHRHQGGLVIYVISGEGYTIVEGERKDWKAGDLMLLPVIPGGVEHQHFNTGPDLARWVAFRFEPFHEALGDIVEQVVNKPDFDGPEHEH